MKNSTYKSTYFKRLFVFPFYRRMVLASFMLLIAGVLVGTAVLFKLHHHIITLFPVTKIGKERMIGYAQYYNYPMYYEPILFVGALGTPFCIFGIIWLLERRASK
jgi:hypothetical protein